MICTLLFIANVWIDPCQVTHLEAPPRSPKECYIRFGGGTGSAVHVNLPCQTVAGMIHMKRKEVQK